MTKTQRIAEMLEKEGIAVAPASIIKGGVTVQGLRLGTGTVAPVVYPETMEGTDEEIVDQIFRIYYSGTPDIDTERLCSWDFAKDRLTVHVRPVTADTKTAKMMYLDLEAYCRLWIAPEQSAKVTFDMLRMYGVSIDELFETAIKNSGFNARPMWQVMIELTGINNPEFIEEAKANDPGLYVVTNADCQEGAGVIMKKEVFREFADELNSNLYILPSSIHEVLILKADEKNDAELREMVTSINQTDVDPTDKLSDNVYFYDRKTDRITIC